MRRQGAGGDEPWKGGVADRERAEKQKGTFLVLFSAFRVPLALARSSAHNGGMPRTSRAAVGGYCYHVLNRGNRRAEVFHDADNYAAFAARLRRAPLRAPSRVLAWCLIPNHFHAVLWPPGDDDLSAWMHWLLTTHASRCNRA